MANNEQALLDQVLLQRQKERAVALPEDEAFELFAAEQALRSRELSVDEVSDGVIGGSNDGGIDAVYVLLGGVPLSEDSEVIQDGYDAKKTAAGTRLELWIVQAKRESSFTETAVEKIADSMRRLLSLGEDEADLLKLYSPTIVLRTGFFRRALRNLASRHPDVAIYAIYASRGDTGSVNSKVEIKANHLQSQLANVMPGASASVEFMGAEELWLSANSIPSYTIQLTYQENATSGNSHVALVQLSDYVTFLTDEQGSLRRHIFDWNVRDYQGDVEVNREIMESLRSNDSPEFWWLNNGITIVCSKATVISKTYSMDNVQVVNGLQTSHSIFRVLGDLDEDHPIRRRSVLVRILVTGDDITTRDQVIRATNRQTSVPAASLRATDGIQRDIEAYFLGNDWFYDRRKNYYRNIGKSAERIVSIPLLAQAAMAMGLGRPDNSRARPSSLLKRDEEYETIFSNSIPLEVYLWLARSQKSIDAFLASESAAATAQERTNLRFHLAMYAAAKLFGGRVRRPVQLAGISKSSTSIEDADLQACLAELREYFAEFQAETSYASDKIAKGSEFVEFLQKKQFPPK
ncbi:AIPR family protein [Mycolicibacterium sp. lyk4-40-TYG-92]|uniref:AIPR family protein n=1 Tax=Mycolicibacterium sp. lyk4-40-TYG-92 TaxID=3040295 RepID=UPI00254D09E3|nr:AIPR family protein [Mycolicibacterium sp. lyk4-40-TYG-92]